MLKQLSMGVLAAVVVAGAAMAAPSGPQKGEGAGMAFQVVDVSGPAKGQQLCYV